MKKRHGIQVCAELLTSNYFNTAKIILIAGCLKQLITFSAIQFGFQIQLASADRFRFHRGRVIYRTIIKASCPETLHARVIYWQWKNVVAVKIASVIAKYRY